MCAKVSTKTKVVHFFETQAVGITAVKNDYAVVFIETWWRPAIRKHNTCR